MAGRLTSWLEAAAGRGGSKRAIYAPETTLSRRGVKTRVAKRARELAAAGVGPGDVVVVALGNVPDLLSSILACDALDAVALPLDPTMGDRGLEIVAERVGLKAVLRRPKGPDAPPPTFPGHEVRGRRRLPMSRIALDALAPASSRPAAPAGARLLHLTPADDGGHLLLAWGDEAVGVAADRVVPALELDEGRPLLCAGLLTVPLLTMVAVPAWLATGAPLVLADALDLATLRPHLSARPVGIGPASGFAAFAGHATAARVPPTLDLAVLGPATAKGLAAAFAGTHRELLALEELGLLGTRPLAKGGPWTPCTGLTFRRGAAMSGGEDELLVTGARPPVALPPLAPDAPGTPADEAGALHTGFAARFDRGGRPTHIEGRDDALVWVDGRRGSLETVEQAALAHPEVTWARADLGAPDGTDGARVELRYGATSPLDDLRPHMVATVPPHMVPERIEHATRPPEGE